MTGMNYAKLNEKKAFVNGKMVIGIDIAKHKHFAALMLPNGRTPCKPFPFMNTGDSFKNLIATIKRVQKEHGIKEIVVAMEPTGHYWEPLAHYLDKEGIEMVFVSPFVVKRTREVMELSRSKNDQKDSYHIAQLASEGKFSYMVLPKGPFADLRDLASFRAALVRETSGIKAMIRTILDTRFPEYQDIFAGILGKTSRAILQNCPFPKDIERLGASGIITLIKTNNSARLGMAKAKKIYDAALCSIGVHEGIEIGRIQLCSLLRRFSELDLQLTKVEEEMARRLEQTGLSDYLLSIPGIGIVSAAMLLGEIGDLGAFNSAKELIKLAGLNLVENQSGIKGGKVFHISRAGRARFRHALYMAAVAGLKHNCTLRAFYLRLVNNGVVGMKAIIGVMGKLLRIVFALCRKGEHYKEHEGSYEQVKFLEEEISRKEALKQVKRAA
jgi:transposase